MKRNGLTLIEILVVASILVMVLGPIWRIFRSGTKTSLQGMIQVETANEARRVLRQIRNDLKQACFNLPASNPRIDFDLLLTTTQNSQGLPEYRFLSFPTLGDVSETVPPTGPKDPAERRVSAVTYRLEKGTSADKPFYQLVREELFQEPLAARFPNKKRTTILSRKVNFFEIKPHKVSSSGEDQFFFWVNLQLVDTHQAVGFTPTSGNHLQAHRPGVLIADFFDVVSPEFFASIWNQDGMRRNWHTLIRSP